MITPEDVIQDMVEVLPAGENAQGFHTVKETLTRMGVASMKDKVLSQSAHILHRRGKYYICHFKEMFALDGLRTDISDADIARRNRIIKMLEDWKMVEVLDKDKLDPMGPPNMVKVIKYSERDNWTLRPKYTIGTKKKAD
jgi:hypothetical protein